jgi:hypothetical protein
MSVAIDEDVAEVTRRLRKRWEEFRRAEPGTRFQRFHDEQKSRQRPWTRVVYLVVAFVSLAIGVVLAFIPGPAVVFFALTAALLAAQSAWLARRLDTAEIRVRHALHR